MAAKKKTGTATKTNPKLWEAAKAEAIRRMGGKFSARAMQLAVSIYKKKGGGYRGSKPTAKSNKLKKWTKRIGVLLAVKSPMGSVDIYHGKLGPLYLQKKRKQPMLLRLRATKLANSLLPSLRRLRKKLGALESKEYDNGFILCNHHGFRNLVSK